MEKNFPQKKCCLKMQKLDLKTENYWSYIKTFKKAYTKFGVNGNKLQNAMFRFGFN